MIQQNYCKEKLDAGHSYGVKVKTMAEISPFIIPPDLSMT